MTTFMFGKSRYDSRFLFAQNEKKDRRKGENTKMSTEDDDPLIAAIRQSYRPPTAVSSAYSRHQSKQQHHHDQLPTTTAAATSSSNSAAALKAEPMAYSSPSKPRRTQQSFQEGGTNDDVDEALMPMLTSSISPQETWRNRYLEISGGKAPPLRGLGSRPFGPLGSTDQPTPATNLNTTSSKAADSIGKRPSNNTKDKTSFNNNKTESPSRARFEALQEVSAVYGDGTSRGGHRGIADMWGGAGRELEERSEFLRPEGRQSIRLVVGSTPSSSSSPAQPMVDSTLYHPEDRPGGSALHHNHNGEPRRRRGGGGHVTIDGTHLLDTRPIDASTFDKLNKSGFALTPLELEAAEAAKQSRRRKEEKLRELEAAERLRRKRLVEMGVFDDNVVLDPTQPRVASEPRINWSETLRGGARSPSTSPGRPVYRAPTTIDLTTAVELERRLSAEESEALAIVRQEQARRMKLRTKRINGEANDSPPRRVWKPNKPWVNPTDDFACQTDNVNGAEDAVAATVRAAAGAMSPSAAPSRTSADLHRHHGTAANNFPATNDQGEDTSIIMDDSAAPSPPRITAAPGRRRMSPPADRVVRWPISPQPSPQKPTTNHYHRNNTHLHSAQHDDEDHDDRASSRILFHPTEVDRREEVEEGVTSAGGGGQLRDLTTRTTSTVNNNNTATVGNSTRKSNADAHHDEDSEEEEDEEWTLPNDDDDLHALDEGTAARHALAQRMAVERSISRVARLRIHEEEHRQRGDEGNNHEDLDERDVQLKKERERADEREAKLLELELQMQHLNQIQEALIKERDEGIQREREEREAEVERIRSDHMEHERQHRQQTLQHQQRLLELTQHQQEQRTAKKDSSTSARTPASYRSMATTPLPQQQQFTPEMNERDHPHQSSTSSSVAATTNMYSNMLLPPTSGGATRSQAPSTRQSRRASVDERQNHTPPPPPASSAATLQHHHRLSSEPSGQQESSSSSAAATQRTSRRPSSASFLLDDHEKGREADASLFAREQKRSGHDAALANNNNNNNVMYSPPGTSTAFLTTQTAPLPNTTATDGSRETSRRGSQHQPLQQQQNFFGTDPPPPHISATEEKNLMDEDREDETENEVRIDLSPPPLTTVGARPLLSRSPPNQQHGRAAAAGQGDTQSQTATSRQAFLRKFLSNHNNKSNDRPHASSLEAQQQQDQGRRASYNDEDGMRADYDDESLLLQQTVERPHPALPNSVQNPLPLHLQLLQSIKTSRQENDQRLLTMVDRDRAIPFLVGERLEPSTAVSEVMASRLNRADSAPPSAIAEHHLSAQRQRELLTEAHRHIVQREIANMQQQQQKKQNHHQQAHSSRGSSNVEGDNNNNHEAFSSHRVAPTPIHRFVRSGATTESVNHFNNDTDIHGEAAKVDWSAVAPESRRIRRSATNDGEADDTTSAAAEATRSFLALRQAYVEVRDRQRMKA